MTIIDKYTYRFMETMDKINKTWPPGGYDLLREVNPTSYKNMLKQFDFVEETWRSASRGAVTDMYFLKSLNALLLACSQAVEIVGRINEPAPF